MTLHSQLSTFAKFNHIVAHIVSSYRMHSIIIVVSHFCNAFSLFLLAIAIFIYGLRGLLAQICTVWIYWSETVFICFVYFLSYTYLVKTCVQFQHSCPHCKHLWSYCVWPGGHCANKMRFSFSKNKTHTHIQYLPVFTLDAFNVEC